MINIQNHAETHQIVISRKRERKNKNTAISDKKAVRTRAEMKSDG